MITVPTRSWRTKPPARLQASGPKVPDPAVPDPSTYGGILRTTSGVRLHLTRYSDSVPRKTNPKPAKAGNEPEAVRPARKMRVDAERNRQLLISAGKAVFAESGSSASLEEIARRAGVGIGTLYRHFPDRDSIIEAVYRLEVKHLAEGATKLIEQFEPVLALHEWMRLFLNYIATKRVLRSALCTTLPGASELTVSSGARILEALTLLMGRAVACEGIRSDVPPSDLLLALAGIAHAGVTSDWEPRAHRLVDLMMDGLQAPGKKVGATGKSTAQRGRAAKTTRVDRNR